MVALATCLGRGYRGGSAVFIVKDLLSGMGMCVRMVSALGRLKVCLPNAQCEGSAWVSVFVLWLVKYLLKTQALNFAVMAPRDIKD